MLVTLFYILSLWFSVLTLSVSFYFFFFSSYPFFSFLSSFLPLFISSSNIVKFSTFYWTLILLILSNSYYAFEIWEFSILDDEDNLLKILCSFPKITQHISGRVIQTLNHNHISIDMKEHRSDFLPCKVGWVVISATMASWSSYIPFSFFFFFLFSWVTLLGHKDWKFPSGSLSMKKFKKRSWIFFPLGKNTPIQTCSHINTKDLWWNNHWKYSFVLIPHHSFHIIYSLDRFLSPTADI